MTLLQFIACIFAGIFTGLALLCLWAILRGHDKNNNGIAATCMYVLIAMFLAWLGDVPLW